MFYDEKEAFELFMAPSMSSTQNDTTNETSLRYIVSAIYTLGTFLPLAQ